MSDKNLREAVDRLAEEWSCPTCRGGDTCVYCTGASLSRRTVNDRLRALLAEHPAEPSSDVTEDELADALWESVDNEGIRGRLYHNDATYLARYTLARFHVTRRADQ